MRLIPGFMRSAVVLLAISIPALTWAQTTTQNTYAAPQQQQKPAATSSQPAGAVSTDSVPPAAETAATSAAGEPMIGPGDLLKVGVLGAPDYDQDIRVTGSGDAVLALVGPVHVAGLTTEQAQELVRQKLMAGGFFTDPQVTVLEKEFATQGVSVLGEVQKPGVYPIMGPRRLFDVLSLAGGTTPKAGQVVTITHRKEPNQVKTVHLSNNPQTNMTANVDVIPGDTVVVAKAGIVYVVGNVRTPTGVIMDNGGNLTVLQAIAMAQGVTPGAALDKSKIIRKTAQGQIEIPIQLKKILGSKKPDVSLQAEDILFVPSSAAKTAAARGLSAAIGLATTVVAYRTIY